MPEPLGVQVRQRQCDELRLDGFQACGDMHRSGDLERRVGLRYALPCGVVGRKVHIRGIRRNTRSPERQRVRPEEQRREGRDPLHLRHDSYANALQHPGEYLLYHPFCLWHRCALVLVVFARGQRESVRSGARRIHPTEHLVPS